MISDDDEMDDITTAEEAFLVEESAVVVLGAGLVIGAAVSSQYHNNTDELVSSYSIDAYYLISLTIAPKTADTLTTTSRIISTKRDTVSYPFLTVP